MSSSHRRICLVEVMSYRRICLIGRHILLEDMYCKDIYHM